MAGLESKKLALIRILQIFQKYSDCDHTLKQEEIARHLYEEHDIKIERKAIVRNISLLKEAGFEIESKRKLSRLTGFYRHGIASSDRRHIVEQSHYREVL